jgi:hypothetical protein
MVAYMFAQKPHRIVGHKSSWGYWVNLDVAHWVGTANVGGRAGGISTEFSLIEWTNLQFSVFLEGGGGQHVVFTCSPV